MKTNIILTVINDDSNECIAPRCRVKLDRNGVPYIAVNNRKLEITSDKFPRQLNVDWNGNYSVDIKEGLDKLRILLAKIPKPNL